MGVGQRLDVSVWNLAIPVALLVACGVPAGDAESDGVSAETSSGATEPMPACEQSSDCPYGYDCVNGFCEYECWCSCGVGRPPEDQFRCPGPQYECYGDEDCYGGDICVSHVCTPIAPDCDLVIPTPEIELAFGSGSDPITKLAFATLPSSTAPTLIGARGPMIAQADAALEIDLFDTGASIADFLIVDFDADGTADLITADAGETPQIRVFRGFAEGSFDPTAIAMVAQGALQIAAAEIDGTGALDLIVRDAAGIWLLAGDGTGGVSAPTVLHEGPVEAMAILDADGDGASDLSYAAAGTFGIVLAGGLAEEQFLQALTMATPIGLHAANFSADVGQDLVALDANDFGQLWSDPVLASPPFAVDANAALGSDARATAVGDVDGDGWDDLVTADSQGSVWVRRGGPAGNSTAFACTWQVPISISAVELAIGDYDGDGIAEVAATDGTRVVTLEPTTP